MEFYRAFIYLGFILQTSVGYSAPSSTPKVSPDDFDKICQQTLDKAGQSSEASPKLQYCQAAASNREAVDTNGLLWKVWAGVGVVCTAACVSSLSGMGTNQYVCTGASVAGGLTEFAKTKNFANALAGIATGGGVMMVNQMANAGVKEGAEKKDYGSCISAASSLYQAYSKHSAMESAEKALKEELAKAFQPESTGASVSSNSASKPDTPNDNSTGGNSSTGGLNSNLSPAAVTNSHANNPCSNAANSGNTGLVVQCAIAGDSNLPKFVGTSQFQNEFKKDSGTDLGNFAAKSKHPGQAYAAAMGGTLNPEQSRLLAAAVRDFQQQLPLIANSQYQSGGSGGGAGGGSDPNFGEMMSGLMGQLAPQNGSESNPNKGMSAVIFANQSRSPATLAEDKTLSIFDRVSYRYYFAGKRILGGGQ